MINTKDFFKKQQVKVVHAQRCYTGANLFLVWFYMSCDHVCPIVVIWLSLIYNKCCHLKISLLTNFNTKFNVVYTKTREFTLLDPAETIYEFLNALLLYFL